MSKADIKFKPKSALSKKCGVKAAVNRSKDGKTLFSNLYADKPSNSYFAALLNPNNFRSEITFRSDYQSDQEVTI